ncbi:MAG: ABC transporter permease [Planctomycetes bacterium]|nr:ABC transporter permease [Planctomycetota bacterium]
MPPLYSETGTLRSFLRDYRNEISLLIAVLVVVAFTTWISSSYREKPWENAKEILRQTSLLGIFALGAGIVIVSGGIDLSSGSVIAFSATICTSIILLLAPQENNSPVTDDLALWILVAAFAGTLLSAFLIGSFHAWLITSIGLPPFVATLASLVGLRSLARLLIEDVTRLAYDKETGNSQIYIRDDFYHTLGTEWWIPLAVFVFLSLGLWLLMSKTVTGRHIYAMGGNEEAARLSGIRTNRLKWLAYCIGTMTAAVAGILHSSYISMAEPVNDGLGYELSAIAAGVVGGCSLAGGIGSVSGIMLGALFLRVVIDSVAKVFKQKPDILEGLVVGILVVLAVAFNELRGTGGLKKQFFPGALGILNILILTLLTGVITAITSTDHKLRNGLIAAAAVLVLLGVRVVLERLQSARRSG